MRCRYRSLQSGSSLRCCGFIEPHVSSRRMGRGPQTFRCHERTGWVARSAGPCNQPRGPRSQSRMNDRSTTDIGLDHPGITSGRFQLSTPHAVKGPAFCYNNYSCQRFTHERLMPKTLKNHAAATAAADLPLQPSPALGARPPANGRFTGGSIPRPRRASDMPVRVPHP